MATRAEKIRQLKLLKLENLKRQNAEAAEPQLPDPMSAEGLALQGSSTLPETAKARADYGPLRSDVPVYPGGEEEPVTRPRGIGRRAMPQSVNKEMESRGMDYNDRADALLGSGPMALVQGGKQILEDNPVTRIARWATGRPRDEEAKARNESDIQDWRDLQAGASMGEGRSGSKWLPDAGTTGRGVSEAATMSFPLTRAEQLLARGGTKQRVGTIGGVGGAEGAAQPVLGDESRAANAAVTAALPATLTAATAAGRRAGTGAFKTNEAAQALEEVSGGKITPTFAQAVDVEGGGVVGNVMAKLSRNIATYTEGIIPGVAKGTKRARQEVFDTIADDASPSVLGMTDIPNPHRVGTAKYFSTLSDQFDEAYGGVLNDIKVSAPGIRQVVNDAIDASGTQYDEALRERLKKALLEGIPEEGLAEIDGTKIKNLMSVSSDGINKAIMGDAGINQSTISMYNAVREGLHDLLDRRVGPAKSAQLKALDEAYAHRQVLEKTAGGDFRTTPTDLSIESLSEAVSTRSTDSMLARQTGTAAELSSNATKTMRKAEDPMWGRAAAGVGLTGWGMAQSPGLTSALVTPPLIAAGLAGAGSRKGGSQFLRGEFGKQKYIAKVMRELIEPKVMIGSVLLGPDGGEQ